MVHVTTWFPRMEAQARQHFGSMVGTPIRYLEIGIYQGGSMDWMFRNVLTHSEARAVGVDCWELGDFPWSQRGFRVVHEQRARKLLEPYGDRLTIIKGFSRDVLPTLPQASFNAILVDGDHRYEGCLEDSRLAWSLAKIGAVVVWDDYNIDAERALNKRPAVKEAVDYFLASIAGQYELLERHKRHFWVCKTTEL